MPWVPRHACLRIACVTAITSVAYALACLATFAVGMAVCLVLSFRFLKDLPES